MDNANQQFQMRPTEIERSFAMCIFFIKAHCTYIEYKRILKLFTQRPTLGQASYFYISRLLLVFHKSHLLFLSMKVDCSYKNL